MQPPDLITSLLNVITKSKIIPAILSDHDLVQLNLTLPKNNIKGPGLWKFNASYLHNKEYVNQIKQTIKETETEYKDIKDKGLLWDLVKMKVRAQSIKLSREFNKKQKSHEINLQKNVRKIKE